MLNYNPDNLWYPHRTLGWLTETQLLSIIEKNPAALKGLIKLTLKDLH